MAVHVGAMRAGAAAVCAAAVLVGAFGASAAAQIPPGAPPDPFSAASRVRCLDREARGLLREALAASPTVARQVAALQLTDLIVGIQTGSSQQTRGDVRVVHAVPGTRHVRLRVRIPGGRVDLISVLGHELQHALEIAAEPGVRDAATMRVYYLRVGYERVLGGWYETEAALDAGRRVAAELAAPRPAPTAGVR